MVTSTTDVALEAVGVSRSFNGHQALRPSDLSLHAAEQLAIMGPSGCGKTTLLNILGGLDRPDSGYVEFGGKRLSYDDRALTRVHRDVVGFVFQGYGLIPSLTAQENVEFTLLARGAPFESRTRRALHLLKAVGLAHLTDRYPEELSGGQRQRVAVARSLAHAPSVVLADEPTGNLDRETGLAVIDLMRGVCAEHGASLIVVTHDVEIAARMARVVHMKDGKVLIQNDTTLAERTAGVGGAPERAHGDAK